jgi:hypothetical protein
MSEYEQVSGSQGSGYTPHHIHRNGEDDAMQSLDLQSVGRGGDGFGFGGGGIFAGLLLGALIGNRGGVFGGGGGDCVSPLDIATLNAVNGISAAVPTVALQVENTINQQTNEITNQISQSTFASLAASAGIKDTVQNGFFGLLAAGNANTKEIVTAIQSVKDQASAYRIADLEQKLTVAQLNERDAGFHRRMDAVEVNVAQTVNQNQQQGQVQAQLQAQGFALNAILRELGENTQLSRAVAANTNFIVGNTGASTTGAQTATPTSTNVKA